MPRYKGVLFATDGGWVTDFEGDTKEEVIEQLANKGSRWYFFPFEGVILDKGSSTTARQRLIDAAQPIEQFKGKSIATVQRFLSGLTPEERRMELSNF